MKQIKKADASITFTCPTCKSTFEFDYVGEYELVHCPICGMEFMTTQKGKALQLELFEFDEKDAEFPNDTELAVVLE